jgi:hypothetical protein
LFVRQKGYKAIFDPEAKFYEYAPKTRNDRIKQKTIERRLDKNIAAFQSWLLGQGMVNLVYLLYRQLWHAYITPISVLPDLFFLQCLPSSNLCPLYIYGH